MKTNIKSHIVKVGRGKLKIKRNSEEIKKTPQIKGIIVKIFTMTPKKPNSALRKVALVKLNKPIKSAPQGQLKDKIIAYIMGENHTLNIHNIVLLINKKTQDLPGVNYKILRGVLDTKPPVRGVSRSKYGVKKN